MKVILTSLLVWLPMLGWAQPPLQVVSKVIDKTMPYLAGQPIQISAQKADVSIKGWDRPTVLVQLKLQAKHPDRSVAEREVAYHHYTLTNEGGQITVANRFIIPQRAGKLQSQLKATYEISLPNQALVRLVNSFGDIHLRALSGEVMVSLEYGTLTLTDVKGKLGIQSAYGDIEGHHLNAVLTVTTERADVTLEEVGGLVEMHSQYGRLSVAPAATLRKMSIEGDHTEVLVRTRRLSDFQVDVATAHAPISVPETELDQLRKSSHKQFFSYQRGERKPEITIKNSYSPVTIQEEKPFVVK